MALEYGLLGRLLVNPSESLHTGIALNERINSLIIVVRATLCFHYDPSHSFELILAAVGYFLECPFDVGSRAEDCGLESFDHLIAKKRQDSHKHREATKDIHLPVGMLGGFRSPALPGISVASCTNLELE